MKDLGGYMFYASKAAYGLAKWAASLDDLDKGLKLKKIADRIETRKRNDIKKEGLNFRFHRLGNKPAKPPITINCENSLNKDFKHLCGNTNFRESELVETHVDWKPYANWYPPGHNWKKKIKEL